MVDKKVLFLTLFGLVLTLTERNLAAGDEDILEIEIDGILSFADGEREPEKFKVFFESMLEKERDKRDTDPPATFNFDGKLTFKTRNKTEVFGTNATFEFQHFRKRRSAEVPSVGAYPTSTTEILGEFRFIDEHSKPRKLSIKSFFSDQVISSGYETTKEQTGTGLTLGYEFKGKLTAITKFGTEKFDSSSKLDVHHTPKQTKREVNVPDTGAILQLEGKLFFRGAHPSGGVYKTEVAINGEVRYEYELLPGDSGPSLSEEFKKGGNDSSDVFFGLDGDLKFSLGERTLTTLPLQADFLAKPEVNYPDRTRRELGKTPNSGIGLDFDGNINVTSGRRRGKTEQTKIKAHLKFWEISSTRNSG